MNAPATTSLSQLQRALETATASGDPDAIRGAAEALAEAEEDIADQFGDTRMESRHSRQRDDE